MMNARLPLLVLLLAAAAPVRAAGLTDFETSLETTMQQTDTAAYKAMRTECDAQKADEAKRLDCLRRHLGKFTEAYEARVKDAKVDPKKGLLKNLDTFEQVMVGQVAMSDPAFKAKFQADEKTAQGDPKQTPGLVAGYRTAITGLTSGYRAKPVESSRTTMTTQITGAKVQLEKTGACVSGMIDGKPCTSDAVAGTPTAGKKGPKGEGKGDETGKKGDGKGAGDVAQDSTEATQQERTGTAGSNSKVVPPQGDLVAKPVPEKPDPNRWNDTIAGAKGALYGALLGFIFGGPMGMLVFGMVGFAAMYGISKMNNS